MKSCQPLAQKPLDAYRTTRWNHGHPRTPTILPSQHSDLIYYFSPTATSLLQPEQALKSALVQHPPTHKAHLDNSQPQTLPGMGFLCCSPQAATPVSPPQVNLLPVHSFSPPLQGFLYVLSPHSSSPLLWPSFRTCISTQWLFLGARVLADGRGWWTHRVIIYYYCCCCHCYFNSPVSNLASLPSSLSNRWPTFSLSRFPHSGLLCEQKSYIPGSFGAWLLALSIIFSRFMCVVIWTGLSFLFTVE